MFCQTALPTSATAWPQLATVASSLFYAVWSLYTGFLITKPNIPGWWIWFYYLCPGAMPSLLMAGAAVSGSRLTCQWRGHDHAPSHLL